MPTLAELGVPDYADSIWVGLAAPVGVPSDIIRRISTEIAKALAAPDIRARLSQIGVQPVGSTPEEAAARIQRETPRYAEAIRQANIRAD